MLCGLKFPPGGLPGNAPPYAPPMESNWMTYAEAAISLGIKPESVKRQARAKKWPRMLGNDGRALVKIPDLPRREDSGRVPRRTNHP